MPLNSEYSVIVRRQKLLYVYWFNGAIIIVPQKFLESFSNTIAAHSEY